MERVTLNASQFDSGDSSFNSSILFRAFHESWMQNTKWKQASEYSKEKSRGGLD
jgi:hypothetical protein